MAIPMTSMYLSQFMKMCHLFCCTSILTTLFGLFTSHIPYLHLAEKAEAASELAAFSLQSDLSRPNSFVDCG